MNWLAWDPKAYVSAVAGALLGARDGEAGLPPRWLEQLGHARGVSALAGRLVTAASGKP